MVVGGKEEKGDCNLTIRKVIIGYKFKNVERSSSRGLTSRYSSSRSHAGLCGFRSAERAAGAGPPVK